MARQHSVATWKELKVGSVVTLTLVVIILGIVNSRYIERVFKSKQVLYVKAMDSGGLRPGAPVTVQGIEVGAVRSISLQPEGIIIKLAVSRTILKLVGKNASASIRTSGLLGGDEYISINRGTPDYPGVEKGDTITGTIPPGMDQIIQSSLGSVELVQNFVVHLDSLVTTIQSGRGLLGSLIKDSVLFSNVRYVSQVLAATARQYDEKDGTIKQLLENGQLYQNLFSAVSEFNDIGSKIDKGQGTLAHLLNEPDLFLNLDSTVHEIRFLADSLSADAGALKSNVSGNLSQTAALLKELVQDMKMHPKKYFTIKLF